MSARKTLVIGEFKSKGNRILVVDDFSIIKDLVKPSDLEHIESLRVDPVSDTKGIISVYTLFAEKIEVNKENYEKFIGKFEEVLTTNYSEKYLKPLDETLRNCIYALLKGDFDKDTESFKQTCKALKVKHTYKAIKGFIYGTM